MRIISSTTFFIAVEEKYGNIVRFHAESKVYIQNGIHKNMYISFILIIFAS